MCFVSNSTVESCAGSRKLLKEGVFLDPLSSPSLGVVNSGTVGLIFPEELPSDWDTQGLHHLPQKQGLQPRAWPWDRGQVGLF